RSPASRGQAPRATACGSAARMRVARQMTSDQRPVTSKAHALAEKTLRVWVIALVLAVTALPAWALLPIQDWQTSSGARVLFVESRGLPMLDLSVYFPAGASYDR